MAEIRNELSLNKGKKVIEDEKAEDPDDAHVEKEEASSLYEDDNLAPDPSSIPGHTEIGAFRNGLPRIII